MLRAIAVVALVTASCGTGPDGTDGAGGAGGQTGLGGLIAYSASRPIGTVLDVTENRIRVFDTESGLVFWVNESTGFVAGGGLPPHTQHFVAGDCSGDAYYRADDVGLARSGGDPCPGSLSRRVVVRDDASNGGSEGWTEAGALYVPTDPEETVMGSYDDGSGAASCEGAGTSALCVVRYEPTTEVPTVFELPIDVVQE